MKKLLVVTALMLLIVLLVQCAKEDQNGRNGENAATSFVALPLIVTVSKDNPQTTQKITLGKLLFWDPVLSGGKDVACGTCHHPAFGYGDGLELSIGVNGQGLGTARHFIPSNNIPFAKRNALSVVNTAFNGMAADGSYNPVLAAMFFDNRVHSLEQQSLEPIKTLEEMMGRSISPTVILDTIVLRLKSIPQYVQLFNDAFQATNTITAQNIGKAIAAYERTLIANHSPYDEYIRGNASAMTAIQIQGMNAFVEKGCQNCHSGPMFSDYSLHILSVPDNPKRPTDAGAEGRYAFRTPSLRNLAFTAPYMHNGMFTSIDAVLSFYERIGNHRSQNSHIANDQLDEKLRRINDRDSRVIIQFLNALNDTGFDKTIPSVVPSGLHPGGNL